MCGGTCNTQFLGVQIAIMGWVISDFIFWVVHIYPCTHLWNQGDTGRYFLFVSNRILLQICNSYFIYIYRLYLAFIWIKSKNITERNFVLLSINMFKSTSKCGLNFKRHSLLLFIYLELICFWFSCVDIYLEVAVYILFTYNPASS